MFVVAATTVLALISSPGYGEPAEPAEVAPPAPTAPTSATTTVEVAAPPTPADPNTETVVVIPTAAAMEPAAEQAPQPTRQPIVDPLPPPPDALPRASLRRGPWRGRTWFGLHLGLTGPIGGARPAKSTATSIGGGVDFGVRATNWLGIGTGLSGQVHDAEKVQVNTPDGQTARMYYGHMIYWDVLFLRLYAPVKRRFQPYVEAGGGLASYQRPTGGTILGGVFRGGVGFDGWVTSNMTLGVLANYRYTALKQKFADGSVKHPGGHAYQVLFELGFHW